MNEENLKVEVNSDYPCSEVIEAIRKLEVPKLKKITESIFENNNEQP